MASISTRNLAPLPDVDSLKALLQSLAVLDSVMSPDDWDMRYFSFNAKWGSGEEIGSMRNGGGDEFFAFFNRSGCFLKGYSHECPMPPYRKNPPAIWQGLLENVPNAFSAGLIEPAFSMSDVTFCIWRLYGERNWPTGQIEFPRSADSHGSSYLLGFLDGKPKTHQRFAEDYSEADLAMESIRHIYQHLPLTTDSVESLNSDATLKMIAKDLKGISYVIQSAK
jgi:hypothetical protein